ncbi:MAG TPA: sporulation transcriptional regulator SpoIIID [Candidatus Limiplasma pullistercoris]|nr:sporulation transcriptional regulator SpoIIID [Candidatus Limiplasma pullistercoris]
MGDAYPFQNVWRGRKVHDRIQERCIRIGQYIADTGETVRGAARHFGVSKSSVHKDMDQRLPKINQTLYRQVRCVLSYNKSVRHLRGGEATRQKYRHC